ncbi:hypothetical protein [Streptomyces acidiscabies]|uniref:Uncharacterized protein n=1 Tax=Streptomyces acidiscabies TaxID=42234 RepID=A0AAP6EHQ7_9ACTN|nr:hypothetical protein [Streptomyces acidiscabies]MBP5939552.1 transposase [Streptomyces sp. LBUM 1476]MBZ3910710.1 hypothetical protein [Streptomyces acidiscabies]MDX2963108.1 hypothetical protein [Streptomyces acidiscabies]MDX3017325.1 hypothetical protein [Streptomyces acidiscabies]MDX3787822.1 hypothetical protein [Streptomyces acidiscabies]
MEAELVALAGTGATTIVGLMATEAWDQVRQRVVRLFTRGGDGSANAMDDELTASRTALVAAPEEETADVTASVRMRLRRLLAENPEAAEELRLLVEEFTPVRGDKGGSTYNTINGGIYNSPVVMGGFIGDTTFNNNSGGAS